MLPGIKTTTPFDQPGKVSQLGKLQNFGGTQ